MASNLSVSLQPEVVRSNTGVLIAAGEGTPGNYVNIGVPLAQPSRLILFQNGTDGAVMISFDGGITDHLPVFAGAFVLLDITTNRTDTGGAFNLAKGTQFAAKSLAGFTPPTTGSFFITSFYAK